jgi:transcriptional regulator with XRE-family HTH domain
MESKGHRIRRLREARGLTQRKLADLIQVDPVTVSRWERDDKSPRDAARARLVGALGVSVATLEGYEDSPDTFTLQDLTRVLRDALQGGMRETAGECPTCGSPVPVQAAA